MSDFIHRGTCPLCGTNGSLPMDDDAKREAVRLSQAMPKTCTEQTGCGPPGGRCRALTRLALGVLVARSGDGERHVFKAFAGDRLSWQSSEWSPPLLRSDTKNMLLRKYGLSVQDAAQLREALPRWKHIETELADPNRSTDKSLLLAEKRQWLTRYGVLREQQQTSGRTLVSAFHQASPVRNRWGHTQTVTALFQGRRPPAGAGTCCGPKLLNTVWANDMIPISMAEWIWEPGRDALTFHASCQDKCNPLLGFQLCPGHRP